MHRFSKESNRVAKQKVTIGQLALPLKVFFNRIAFFIFLLLAFASLALSKTQPETFEQLRMHVLDGVTPVLTVISSPLEAVSNARVYVGELVMVYEQNALLKAENEKLKRTEAQIQQLSIENRNLRDMVRFVSDAEYSYITARVITDSSGPFARSAIVNVGGASGIDKGAVVTNKEGVVGRIQEVGAGTGRILLLTDINSRIPITTEITGERAIVAGTNSNRLKLLHLPLDSHAAVGEKLYTSGDGAYFPAGLPVAIIESVSSKGVTARPLVDWSRLQYVNVVDYNRR